MKLGVIILGAGASSRMGRSKLLLPWQGATVIEHLVEMWRSLGIDQLAVVTHEADPALHAVLDRASLGPEQRILNPHPEKGMFSSIQSAARWSGWNPALTHFAIVLGDQPLVQLETVRGLLKFARLAPEPVCQPSRSGRGRHPVILAADVFFQLKNSPALHLKEFLQARPRALWECEDRGLDLDLDEPADYERALALAEAGRLVATK